MRALTDEPDNPEVGEVYFDTTEGISYIYDGTDWIGFTTEVDPVYSASAASGIGTGDISNWNTAHGWGDHALAGYLTEESWVRSESGLYYNSGNVGIGTQSPVENLDVAGGINIGTTTSTNAGTLRWTGTDFEGYNGSA